MTIVILAGAMYSMFCVSPLNAQQRPSTDDLLPETTVVFVQLDNWRDFVEKFRQGSLGQMLNDERIAPIARNAWEEAQNAYKEVEDEVGVALDDFVNLPHGEITVAVIAPRRKDPVFMVIVETDPESEAADRILSRGKELIEDEGGEISNSENDDGFQFETIHSDGNRFKYFRKDGLFVGSNSDEELDHLIDRWMGREVEKVRPLSKNRKFITIMNRCRGTKDLKPEARFYCDPIELVKSSTRGDIGAQVVITMLPMLGLDGLLGIGGSMLLSEDEFQSVMHTHILLAEPRKGVFQMFAFRPTDYQPEPWMPADTTNYFTTSWDFPQMLAELTKLIEMFQEEGTVDRFFEENLDKQLEFDFRKEFIENLTGRVTFAQWIDPHAALNSANPVFAFEVKDVEQMEACLQKIFERTNRDQAEDSPFRWKDDAYHGIPIYSMDGEAMQDRTEERQERFRERQRENGQRVYEAEIKLNPAAPCYGMVGNYLVFSPQSRQTLELLIDTDRGEFESLAQSRDYQRVSEKMTRMLKSDSPSAIMYSDPRHVFRWMFDIAKSESSKAVLAEREEDSEFARRMKKLYDENPLPDFSEVEHYFQPQGAYMTSDDTGLHFLFFELRAENR